jgi:hypothetical protein
MKNPVKKILCTVMALLVVGTSGVVFTGCGSDSEEYTTITWATSGIGSLAPKPKSTKGKISIDSEDSYQATISEVSVDDFKSYVNDCKKKGFDVDYTSVDGMYTAKDKKGYDLSVYYQDDEETMDIIINAPEQETTAEKTTKGSKKKSSKKSTSSSDNVSPEFKATMDSYEEFFNDYVDFMKKYKNSTDITSMASDYADYMTKYSDMMQKLNDIKSEDLSTADLAYYNEVNARITKKLAEVAN